MKKNDFAYSNDAHKNSTSKEIEKIEKEIEEMKKENDEILKFRSDIIENKTKSAYSKLIYNVLHIEESRDLTSEQSDKIRMMQQLAGGLIGCGWGYEQIKQFIQENNVNKAIEQ